MRACTQHPPHSWGHPWGQRGLVGVGIFCRPWPEGRGGGRGHSILLSPLLWLLLRVWGRERRGLLGS